MDTDSHLTRLRSVPLFSETSDSELRHLAQGGAVREFKANELVVREGEPGDELFVTLEGEFQVFLRQEALDYERELHHLGPGSYFGEIAVLTGEKRSASVRSLGDSKALVLKREGLVELVHRSPGFGLALCRGMTEYIRRARQGGDSIPFVSLDAYPNVAEIHVLVPARISEHLQAVAVARDKDLVTVALVNPQDVSIRTFLRSVLRQYRVNFVAINHADFTRHRSRHLSTPGGEAATDPAEQMEYIDAEGRAEPFTPTESGGFLQGVLAQALQSGASDLHFEPGLTECRVRMRIDGNLFPTREQVPVKLFNQVVSRLKVMSDLDITSRRIPQDGRFPLRTGRRQVEVRVSVTPCQGGEKVVLRLLDPARQLLELSSLVYSRPLALLLEELFLAPAGLVLVCGPTGSGKTTTLYAGLNTLWKRYQSVNIVTAEDPVEYQLPFATQIGVNRAVGYDFPQILRTILRQDPDVLLLGEIRDVDTAEITLEAASTGHLVLSSLHTDFALEAVSRLRSLNVKPYLLAGALRGVICQRLLPRVCKNCAAPVPADDAHVVRLKAVGVLPQDWAGVCRKGQGCEACRGQGEIGRVGVFEVLTVNDHLRGLIEESAPWSAMAGSLTPDVFVPMSRYSRFLLEEGLVAPERVREIFHAKSFSEVPTFLADEAEPVATA